MLYLFYDKKKDNDGKDINIYFSYTVLGLFN